MLPIQVRRNGRAFLAPTDSVQREFEKMFDRFWGENEGTSLGAYPVDIREDDDNIYVEAEMPGFKKDEIDVTLENSVLTITAERKTEEKQGMKHLSERRFARVARRFSLPTGLDESNVEAQLSDGVLQLTLHKKPEVKPKKIEVK